MLSPRYLLERNSRHCGKWALFKVFPSSLLRGDVGAEVWRRGRGDLLRIDIARNDLPLRSAYHGSLGVRRREDWRKLNAALKVNI